MAREGDSRSADLLRDRLAARVRELEAERDEAWKVAGHYYKLCVRALIDAGAAFDDPATWEKYPKLAEAIGIEKVNGEWVLER